LQFSGGIGNHAFGSCEIAEETSNTKNSTSKEGGIFYCMGKSRIVCLQKNKL